MNLGHRTQRLPFGTTQADLDRDPNLRRLAAIGACEAADPTFIPRRDNIRGLTRERTATMNPDQIEAIARVCHEANRAWCASNGDFKQPTWEEAPDWQRASAIAGVKFHIENPDASASASHDSWRAQKVADGWTYGPEKRPDLKQHHCMVDFDKLPPADQAKDHLFRATVHALAPFVGRA